MTAPLPTPEACDTCPGGCHAFVLSIAVQDARAALAALCGAR